MNGKRRIAVLFLLFGTLLVSLVLSAQASASPVSDKKARLREVQAKLQVVYRQADTAVEKYDEANSRLSAVTQQMTQNAHFLKVTEYNLSIANQELSSRAQNIYKSRDVGVIDVLFSSNSFDDLVTQLDVMQRLGDNDADTVRSIAAYKQDIKDRRVTLNADKTEATKLVRARGAQKEQVLALKGKLEHMTAGLKSEINRAEQAAAAAAKARAQAAASASASGGGSGAGSIPDPGGTGRSAVVAIAQRYLGVPYVYGGESPSGFDCSGLAQYCYAQAGVSIPRTATDQQHASTEVPLSALQPGDLVFYGGPGFSYHVAIYVGNGSTIEAPYTGADVRYGSVGSAWIGGRF